MKRTGLIRPTAALLALLLSAPALIAGQGGAAGSYDEAVRQAAERGVPLVLDFYTEW